MKRILLLVACLIGAAVGNSAYSWYGRGGWGGGYGWNSGPYWGAPYTGYGYGYGSGWGYPYGYSPGADVAGLAVGAIGTAAVLGATAREQREWNRNRRESREDYMQYRSRMRVRGNNQ